MPGFYDDIGDMVQDLLLPDAEGGLGQGTVQLKRTVTTPGADPWDPPSEDVTAYTLKAAVRRVSTKYVDGTLILATDNQVTFAVPAVTPLMTDTLSIDGKDHAMKDLRPLPGAGTVAAYIAFIAA
jgi:hypothetical protein